MVNLSEEKNRLINELIKQGFLQRQDIIKAFRQVKRERFLPKNLKDNAYDNYPLPIGEGQTISQPLTIAAMTEALQPQKGQKILEVGAGSGYQAAILAEIVGPDGRVITTERIENLVEFAKKNLKKYDNVTVVNCDGSSGYPKEAPYDRIIVTASAPEIPEPLVDQLNKHGRMVIPVGDEMFLVEKENNRAKRTFLGHYVFVPLLGEYGYKG